MMQEIDFTLSGSPEDLWDTTMGMMESAQPDWTEDDDFLNIGNNELNVDNEKNHSITNMDSFMIEGTRPQANMISLECDDSIMDFDVEESGDGDDYLFDQMVVTPPQKSKDTVARGDEMGQIPRLISPHSSFSFAADRTLSSSSLSSSSSSSSSSKSAQTLQEEYMKTLQKLAASMKRSEVTRKEIIRHQLLAENQVKKQEQPDFAHDSRSQVWSFIEAHNEVSCQSA